MKIIIICFIISSLFIQSCGKPQCKNEFTKDIDSNFLLYFGKYKPNNWWVYENATKSKRDSIFIDESVIKFYDLPQPNNTAATDCERTISGKLTFTAFGNIPEKFDDNFKISSSELLINGADIMLTLSDDKKNIVNKLGSLTKIDSFYLLPNKLYLNIWKIENNSFDNNRSIYVAPNVGIIRFESKTDTFILSQFKIN